MGIIRTGNQLRLTGAEAEKYLRDTGRSELPKTVQEYNRALRDSIKAFRATNDADGCLLAALMESDLLPENF